MDKFKFAEFIAWLSLRFERTFGITEMETIDRMITDGMPSPQVNVDDLTYLLASLRDNKLIDAIKMHRKITGFPLKESKDAVEAMMPRATKSFFPLHVEYATGARAVVNSFSEIPANTPFIVLQTNYDK